MVHLDRYKYKKILYTPKDLGYPPSIKGAKILKRPILGCGGGGLYVICDEQVSSAQYKCKMCIVTVHSTL
jgi:hypothetical protein